MFIYNVCICVGLVSVKQIDPWGDFTLLTAHDAREAWLHGISLSFFHLQISLEVKTSPTWYCRRPINREAFTHVSWETEECGGFFLFTDESSHSSRTVDSLQLRLEVKDFNLSLLRPHGSQRLLSTSGRLQIKKQSQKFQIVRTFSDTGDWMD